MMQLILTAAAIQVHEIDATDTVLPLTAEWLNRSKHRHQLILAIKSRCKRDSYRSDLDYLVAAAFPGMADLIREYYADRSPPLRDLLTVDQQREVDRLMVDVLIHAWVSRRKSWDAAYALNA